MSAFQKRTIAAVSEDGLTLTLDEALEFDHLGENINVGGGNTLAAYGEVALLTRNVKVMGSNNAAWNVDIPACEAGFQLGRHTV